MPCGRAVHWGVLDARNALFIAASRIACIEIAVVQLAALSVLISPDVASERVRLRFDYLPMHETQWGTPEVGMRRHLRIMGG